MVNINRPVPTSYVIKVPTWRDICRPIIRGVLDDTRGQPPVDRRRALRRAYPFGERDFWPYKVWLSEVKRQLNDEKQGRLFE